ncbi:hypothetical protein GGR52DRAFT_572520 [Hypoxylon sp. FL1284]|nr:hypothetical protein GGR52DRAFT_572520 [Hypoxylon sp. FL1284]
MPQPHSLNLLTVPRQSKKQPICQCECRKVGVGICTDAPVGSNDPDGLLCDICHFEVTKMKGIRKREACNYPPRELSRPSSRESRRRDEKELSIWSRRGSAISTQS